MTSDVYALGWEILIPLPKFSDVRRMPAWKNRGLTDNIWSCMGRYWDKDFSQRLTANEVVQLLTEEAKEDTRLANKEVDETSGAGFRRRMTESMDIDALNNILDRISNLELDLKADLHNEKGQER
ncbi:hypothetical protein C0995_011933 [Termitomyces sp. Mi166|nr:hypothetical protein C0995_011933 [Termitomyces sp. Mi166\